MSIRMLLTAAGLLASVYTTSALAAEAATEATPASHEDVALHLDTIADLIADKKVVRAKDLLSPMLAKANLSDAERQRVVQLLTRATNAIGTLDASEFAVQSAEVAVETGDLLGAERHANKVVSAPKATNEQSERARAVLASVTTKRAEVVKGADELLASAASSFESGRYAQSRSTLETLTKSGAELSADQTRTLAAYQTRLVEISEANLASAGMMAAEQPGVVKERDDKDQPEVQPEVTSQPKPAPAPAPVVQPAITAQSGARQSAPNGDEMIRQAQRVEAQAILAEAEQAFNERRLNEAVSKYSRVKTQYREFLTAERVQRIDNRLAECRSLLGSRNDRDILTGVTDSNRLIREETDAMYNNYFTQANTALDGGDWEGARLLAAQAKVKVEQNRSALSETEFQNYLRRQRELIAEIARRQEAARNANADVAAANLAIEEQERRATASEARQEKINASLARIRALQSEMKYDEAIQVCDNILFLDPINPSALTLKAVLEDAAIYTRMGAAKRKTSIGLAGQSADNMEALRPTTNIVTYPNDWEQVSARRGGGVAAFQDSPENRRTLAMLGNKRTPVKFKDNSLTDVLNFVQAVTQVNMDVDWASLESVGVDKDRPITLELTNVPVTTVLDRVMEKASDDVTNGAAWAVYDGVLTIESREQLNRKTKLQIYDIRDLLINVPNFTNAPEFDLQQALQSRRGGGGGQPPFRQTNQGNQQENQGPTIEERQDELIKIITENVDRDTWVDNGGSVGKIQRFQGNLIITQTPSNHRMVDGLLSDLRKFRAVQINVETRFLLVRQDWFEQIGLDLDVYFNAKNNQVRAARGVAPQATARDFFDFRQGGYRGGGAFTPQAIDINRDGDLDDPNEQGDSNPLFSAAPSPLSPVAAEQNSLGLAESLIGGNLASNVLQNGPALGVAGQFLDDIQVDFLVKATQADDRSVTLTAPRVTLMNGQISNFYVVSQSTFVSDLTPVTSESAVGFDPEVDVQSEGVTMLVEGTVSADRRYVTLNVDASIARSGEARRVAVTAVAGGQLVNSAQTSSFIELPLTTVTRVQTTVSVPDQGTILMGGQRLITEQEVETGVPVLSKIPFLNRFFTNRLYTKEEQTLLVLVKPTVIIQSEQEEQAFPGAGQKFGPGGWGN